VPLTIAQSEPHPLVQPSLGPQGYFRQVALSDFAQTVSGAAMADRDGDSAFFGDLHRKEEVPHCGLCDPHTRHIERDDGRIARCPRCWPPHADKPKAPGPHDLLPQHWRCGGCHALIYITERGVPCSKHRTVEGWQRDYDAAAAGVEPLLPNPVTETGAKDARTQLATRPRPEPEPADPPEAEEDPAGEDDYPF
jgi:hypothetical protein